jgi:hypothetical protein
MKGTQNSLTAYPRNAVVVVLVEVRLVEEWGHGTPDLEALHSGNIAFVLQA